MCILRKIGLAVTTVSIGIMTSPAVLAATRPAESQGKYLGTTIEVFILALTSLMFLASLAVLLIAGWFLIRDYVMKDDREKRFSFPQLMAAMVVAGILGFPAGAYILGQDLLSGNQGGSTPKADAFKRTGT